MTTPIRILITVLTKDADELHRRIKALNDTLTTEEPTASAVAWQESRVVFRTTKTLDEVNVWLKEQGVDWLVPATRCHGVLA